MTLLTDFIPVVAFFIAYRLFDLYIATAVIIGVTLLQIVINLFKKAHITVEQWINTAVITGLGGTTLISNNSNFIKWKPSIVYALFALILAWAPYYTGRTLLQKKLGHVLSLSQTVWMRLNYAWVGFFFSMSILNLIVAYHVSTHTWVYFKLLGLPGLTLLFIMLQIAYFTLFNHSQLPYEYNT